MQQITIDTIRNLKGGKSSFATLTAYDFTLNDVYKIWAAERSLNKKTQYLILQHGGNSGLAESAPGTDLHSLLADKYLTWGWKGKYKNYIPFHSVLLSNQSLTCRLGKPVKISVSLTSLY